MIGTSMLNATEIKRHLSDHFDLIGICPAVTPRGLSHFHQWLDAGYAGEMTYLPDRREAYAHPKHVLDGVRSIIMLGTLYAASETHPSTESDRPGGRIARYARGSQDYHDVIHGKLKSACRYFQEREPNASFRGVVDTAPLLERDFARLAGIGWQGKNTMLISRTKGSWFFLAALLTDLTLDYDQPLETNHCGTCTACLEACPTGAFVQEYVLDARRCLSYWNIESRSLPPLEIREQMSDWLFGCDVCQEVCPWNRKPAAYVPPEDDRDPAVIGVASPVPPEQLVAWLELSDAEFRQKFRQTAMWRGKRRGLLRNALIVLGNLRDARWLAPIAKCLSDEDPLVRSAAAWAVGRIGGPEALKLLQEAATRETDPQVRRELSDATGKND